MAVLLVCACAAGCKSRYQKRILPRPNVRIAAVAVYPFGFRWDEPAYRSFELSQRLIEVAHAKAGERFLLFGPSEFRVFRRDDPNAWAASSVLTLMGPARVRPQEAVIVRPWAERRVHSSQKEVHDAKGQPAGMVRIEETTYLGHVEIIHPSANELLVEVSGETTVDPFAERPEDDADPAPELTALMEALLGEAITALAANTREPARTPEELPVQFAFNPKQALTFSDERPPLEPRLAEMDPLEAELLVQARVKFANPALPDHELGRLSRLPGGLLVREAEEGSKLAVGDLITEIDGQPALPQGLWRLRFADAPGKLAVLRAGQRVEVSFP